MRALQQTGYGNPQDVVHLVDLPDPEPGPGQIVIEIEAAGLHIADLKNFGGEEGFRMKDLPRIPGYEGVGRVVKVGEGVTDFAVGDRAMPRLGGGTFTQLCLAEAATSVAVPEGDAHQLALATTNGATAMCLADDYGLQDGDWLIQNGANSNCGRYLIVLAKQRGIKTVNVIRREEVRAELEALGADVILMDGDDLADRVAEATGGADIKVGFDMVAGPATIRIARCLGEKGRVVNYGFISKEPCHMSFLDMFRRGVTLEGMSMGTQMGIRTRDEQKALLADVARMVADGTLEAKIAGAYTLEQAQEAFKHAGRTGSERDGKVIILPNG